MSLAQLAKVLPLPGEDLQQVLDYANTLSPQGAVEHFNALLGETPQSIEFISSFNARRKPPPAPIPSQPSTNTTDSYDGVPKASRRPPKKKAPLHSLTPRQVENNFALQGTAYNKKDDEEYMTQRPSRTSTPGNASSLSSKPAATQAPVARAPPSAAGSLISDFKTKSSSSSRNISQTNSRNASPAPKKTTNTKVTLTGGQSMHGASSTLSTLDSAIRALEISTNSSLLLPAAKRRCNCIGARHPLLAAAPNCLNCGKVICVKEGLGPCTFCNTPLLSAQEVQSMIHELRRERGEEKMALDANAQRKPEVSKAPAPFSKPKEGSNLSPAEAAALAHRDKLLNFQSQNAKRTTVHDEAADFEVPTAGQSMWASPKERARQLKVQQKVLAEQQWNALPEYDKRRQVVSIDVVKGKVVKRMAAVEKPNFETQFSENEDDGDVEVLKETSGNLSAGGNFSRNPLLGSGLIKPVWSAREADGKGKGKETDTNKAENEPKRSTWRRVQDDLDDNEAVILDGGAFGDRGDPTNREEPACG